eukprot:CFRG0413T1
MIAMDTSAVAAESPQQDFMTYLDDAVVTNQKMVTYKLLSRELKVSMNMAKRMLHTYVEKRGSNSPSFGVYYAVGGYTTKQAIQRHVVATVDSEKLEGMKDRMKPLTFVHVISVQPKKTENHSEMFSTADTVSSTIIDRVNAIRAYSQITCSTIEIRKGQEKKKENPAHEKKTSSVINSKSRTTLNTTTSTISPEIPKSTKSTKVDWAAAQMATAFKSRGVKADSKTISSVGFFGNSKSDITAVESSRSSDTMNTENEPKLVPKSRTSIHAKSNVSKRSKPPPNSMAKKLKSYIESEGEENIDSESDAMEEDEEDEDIQPGIMVGGRRPNAARRGVVDDSSSEEEEDFKVGDRGTNVKSEGTDIKIDVEVLSDNNKEIELSDTNRSTSVEEEELEQEKNLGSVAQKNDDNIIQRGVDAKDVDTEQLLAGLDDDMDMLSDDAGVGKPTPTSKSLATKSAKNKKLPPAGQDMVPAPRGINVPAGKKIVKVTRLEGKRMITENQLVDDEEYVAPKRQKILIQTKAPEKTSSSAKKGTKGPKKGQSSITSFFKKS